MNSIAPFRKQLSGFVGHPALSYLFLVRRMTAQCAQMAALSIAVLLSSCETDAVYGVSNSIRFSYPTMGFAGHYSKQLTIDDVRQIVQLAKQRADILKPVDQIIVDHPAVAEVHSGDARNTGDRACTFHVQKRDGRWFITDKPSCNQVIITS